MAGLPIRCAFGFVLAIALASPARADGERATDPARVRVALLPLVVRATERREVLQQGLADMLVARLGRDERLAVIEVEDPAAATADAEKAREIGRAQEAAYVVFGTLTHVGEGAGLELRCAAVADDDREARQVFAHADTLAGLIPMLDGVARRLAAHMVGAAREPPVGTGPKAVEMPEADGGKGAAPDRTDGAVR